ncbi:MAG: hypothetical protein HXY51_04925 [Nitrospirae bacterium]|nr:hypothetical protein [Nitrospirota bacterium]
MAEEKAELAYCRSLLTAAANGEVLAQRKLRVEYHVRVYSLVERRELAVTSGSRFAEEPDH